MAGELLFAGPDSYPPPSARVSAWSTAFSINNCFSRSFLIASLSASSWVLPTPTTLPKLRMIGSREIHCSFLETRRVLPRTLKLLEPLKLSIVHLILRYYSIKPYRYFAKTSNLKIIRNRTTKTCYIIIMFSGRTIVSAIAI